jgi:hypothetical protein
MNFAAVRDRMRRSVPGVKKPENRGLYLNYENSSELP